MLLATALKGMATHREALLDSGNASNPTFISEHRHRLAQYISSAEEHLADLESELEVRESEAFNSYIKEGRSVNAANVSTRRQFTKERVQIKKLTRLTSSSWKLVNECQSRVKDLIAEANNQI